MKAVVSVNSEGIRSLYNLSKWCYKIERIDQGPKGLIFKIEKDIWLQVYEFCHPKFQPYLKKGNKMINNPTLDLVQNEEEENKAKVPFIPRVITGGKGPPEDPNNPDWLTPLSLHTTFLVQNKKDTSFLLGQFTVVHKGKKVILLFQPGNKEPIPVDPIRFCRDFTKYEVLQTGEEYELERKANEIVKEEETTTVGSPPWED